MAKITKKQKEKIAEIIQETPDDYSLHLNLDKIEFEIPKITWEGKAYKVKNIDLERMKKLEKLEKKFRETNDWSTQVDIIDTATEIPRHIIEKMGQHIIIEIGLHIIKSAGRFKKKEKKSG